MAAGESLPVLAEAVDGSLRGRAGSEVIITDVTHDSREAAPGWLYVAIRGGTADGHDFVPEAVTRGASAVCVTHMVTDAVPEIVVDDTRRALGPLASMVHGVPSSAMSLVGITGTNGKTTVAHHVASMAADCGVVSGLIGTIHTRIDGEVIQAVRTTPEATDFQRILARMRDRGAGVVAVEVSSHGLEMGRVRATRFAVAAFTNLSQDHLDFHGDMESYLAAKRRLFEEYEVGTAVLNIDDAAGAGIAAGYRGRVLRVGSGGDVTATERRTLGASTAFVLHTPWGRADVEAPVVGGFNVDNVAMAAACSLAVGLDFDGVMAAIGTLEGVPGRFEVVSGDDPIMVVVDYAHTPDGISKLVSVAREMNRGRVIALIGAGGDRDREKRPLMGAAASGADLVVVTSDNPRSEDPDSIARAVRRGVAPGTDLIYELDRRVAIDLALEAAHDGDVVLVMGRGHEPLQEIAGDKLPFDDRVVVREALARRRMSADFGNESGSIG